MYKQTLSWTHHSWLELISSYVSSDIDYVFILDKSFEEDEYGTYNKSNNGPIKR